MTEKKRRNRKGIITLTIILGVIVALGIFTGVQYAINRRPTTTTDISPLVSVNDSMKKGRRLEISFTYESVRSVGSSQFAFWIEDMDGNYIDSLYVTYFTARARGYEHRPQSLPLWVSAAQPADMLQSELDTISGATPKPGNFIAYWDFTDRNGNIVTDTQFRYFVHATMFMNENVLYSGTITLGDEVLEYNPLPEYNTPDSENNNMISNVKVTFYPN